jgi:hypothetical protein
MFPCEAEGVLVDGAFLSGFFFWCDTGAKEFLRAWSSTRLREASEI